ncbi:alanine--tRNA ligase [Pseudonocardia asaccharolytica]|uniref:Alanine--tRNA ligase n=1 Tax=Pseudonocardia asaccharolytica DSM 44247 = NBRC 16224 TaxID=1123024 RepID=A0A511D2N8_9PSEU|nr:alanine--tRNA ligase [Pseudonocardia asaccharolytica]GEL19030.1 alanine--tRNA ligase [Pseudonocardia asaccharolytica DSM 44247 = NBRC 16224]
MQTHEIARRFTEYFTAAGHTRVPSASLILDDPTLLFVNAGMVQFKPYFLGEAPPPYPRATSIQKCVRTGDIDEVGRTTRHNTFFQMAGNFSFGDYFKAGAIEHAWKLVTGPQSEGGYGFDPDRIWVTVYLDDNEAAELWRSIAGIPAERIQRRSGKDNYWDMGVPGPGGPCSEIYFDRGPEHGAEGGPVVDEDRYLEIWNLVFMQDVRDELSPKDGYPPIGELPSKNIDTGMGVERVAYLLQGVENVYETDLVRPVIARAEEFSGRRYGADHDDDVRFRVIADHARSGVMIIGDGVTPSNEGRGYVLRRLLRRIVRSSRLLGVREPVLNSYAEVVRDAMVPSYPELVTDFERISAVVRAEEEAFLTTLTAGSRIFDLAVTATKAGGGTQLAGDKAFQLHDTYGFPIDLTLEMAAEAGLTVDEQGFRTLMAEQRARAKADAAARKTGHGDAQAYRAVLDAGGGTEFLGYTDLVAEARIVGLIADGAGVPAAGAGSAVEVVLDRTPFYAEGGGQQADTGVVRGDGFAITVTDVQSPVTGLIVHRGTVDEGEATVDAVVHAEVDTSRRAAISRSHSATHLVHTGMRRHLGDAAAQAGSLNAPGRLRFDFTSPGGAVPASVLSEVEDEVNAVLTDDHEVRAFVTSQEEARRIGALALFGEKYGDAVRVVEIGDYSRELCGGTHVHRSGQLGLVKLLSEASIGSGVRRVEALVGLDAFRFLAREHVLVSQLAEQFKARPEELPERIGGIVERLRAAERELEKVRADALLASAGSLADAAENVNGIALVAVAAPEGLGGTDLRALATDIRGRLGTRQGVVALFSADGDKVSFVVATTAAARDRGVAAGKLIPAFAPAVGGRGGGKPDLAQGGGGDPSGIPAAIDALRGAVAAA